MKAIFVTAWKATGEPSLPDMSQISYTNAQGELTGGYSVLSPLHNPTCVVAVDASRATLDAMISDTENYLLIEEIEDATS